MDPFNTLYASTTPLIDQLESTSPQSLDFLTLQNEIVSCIHDLEESIKTVESDQSNLLTFADITPTEIQSRKEKIKSLNRRLNSILQSKNISHLPGSYGENPFQDEEPTPQFMKEYHQQLLQQQDDLINNELTNSINNLHHQAITINNELSLQQEIIDDVDDRIDRLNVKIVNNGMKRINKFLETNEMGGNCCIAILITVLIIILVLLVIV